jgi:hypothetical protein
MKAGRGLPALCAFAGKLSTEVCAVDTFMPDGYFSQHPLERTYTHVGVRQEVSGQLPARFARKQN